MNKKINIDYIGVVRELRNGKMEYTEVPILNPYDEIMDKLSQVDDKKEYNELFITELHDRFYKIFKYIKPKKCYNYCLPHKYNESYIDACVYPKFIILFDQPNSLDIINKIMVDNNWKEATYDQLFEVYNRSHRIDLCKKMIRYLNAFNIEKTIIGLKCDPSNKMFSTENRGFTEYDYKLNNDISFKVKSNFCYGNSSFFFVNITYKDIDILPYSQVVTYYYANMADLIKYTRSYEMERENWERALRFVVETVNESADETLFIEKFIIDEINRMMQGLEELAEDPVSYFYKNIKRPLDTVGLIAVRNITNDEWESYEIYQKEFSVAFQADKISGSLLFLEKLRALISIYPQVLESINRIIELNRNLLPKLVELKSDLDSEISKSNEILQNKISKKKNIESENRNHFTELNKRLKRNRNKKSETTDDKIKDDYFADNKEFKAVYEEFENLRDQIIEDQKHLKMREKFSGIITNAIELIHSKINLGEELPA